MNTVVIHDAASDARAVAAAANSVLRALRSGGELDAALERLELQAARTVGSAVQGFDDDGGATASPEELLSLALSQLGIGQTLLSAQVITVPGQPANRLEGAVAALDQTADAIEAVDAPPAQVQRFDSSPDGAAMGIADAARAALDEMAAAAGEVATAVLDKTLKPIINKVPASLKDLGRELNIDVGSRLVSWGMRAVRRGLSFLQQLVSLDAIERQRANIDSVLARLGAGDDTSVVAGWLIGADDVRAFLVARTEAHTADAGRLDELVRLGARFVRLCRLLRRTALLIAGLATSMSLLALTLPQAPAITALGLVVVLGVTVVVGRMYTGVIEVPGGVRGVRAVLQAT